MIERRLNLRCSAGHLHYAPPAELADWIGRDCLHGSGMRANGQTMAGRCRRVLGPLTVWRCPVCGHPHDPGACPADAFFSDDPIPTVMRRRQ